MSPVASALTLGVLTLFTVEAAADPVTPRTITGYSAAAAAQQGKSLEVPVGQGPMEDGAPAAAVQGSSGGQSSGAAAPSAQAGAGGESVGAPAAPRKVRYGLFGLSWRSQ
ncbi:hypothetical protein ACFQI3_14180 [Hansschlegelia quercus]|uniref:Uncharacterized protein n=1 Tax=Hansschlegelia quercus TaxID=2528245 RepID=A0A4Q9GBK1_9HYPH|nr:hypothetical protein [Hansschlegelia quercus]TBN48651.1 hypothetical protein EYR15_13775 [Hansschlegelia quercus]